MTCRRVPLYAAASPLMGITISVRWELAESQERLHRHDHRVHLLEQRWPVRVALDAL